MYLVSQLPGAPDNAFFKLHISSYLHNYKSISTHLKDTDWE